MASLWLDLRYALRVMAKAPGLTAVLVTTLALGIGATTTIFSVVSSVVLRPLPYDRPEQLVRAYTEFRGTSPLDKFWFDGPEVMDLAASCRTCASVGGWTRGRVSLAGGDRPIRVEAAHATHQLLPLLGVRPQLGRWFDATEARPGDPQVIVLGHDVWQRAFAGDPSIIGRKILADANPVTVIGVMPRGFDFLDREEAWLPMAIDLARHGRGSHFLNVVIRLRDGATLAQLDAELSGLMLGWGMAAAPDRHAIAPRWHPIVTAPLHADVVGSLARTLWLLQAAVLVVLLIAVVNVANLLLASAEARTREVAVRHALGASRGRLTRQLLTESLVLGLLGGGLGVLVAAWAIDGVTALIPRSVPRATEIALDGSAVGVAVVCSVIAAALFGMAPILHANPTHLHAALNHGGNRMTGSRRSLRVRRALVIAEIALAVVLATSCAVMVQSFNRLQRVDLGYRPDHLLTFSVELPRKTYPDTTGDGFWDRLEARLRALPGVVDVTLMDGMPPSRPRKANSFTLPDRPQAALDPERNVDYWQSLGATGFEALGARIVRGRGFAASDTRGAPLVMVVNEAFARRFFPTVDPIGQRVILAGGARRAGAIAHTVVGVVADLKNAGLEHAAGTEVVFPRAQVAALFDPPASPAALHAVLRTAGDPAAQLPAVQRAVAAIDPTLPLHELRTMDDVLWEAVARPRFLTFLLTAFAALALVLAAVGIYGVMAQAVAQRTQEIGLRVALGARPAQVRAMVLRQAATLVAAGVAVGGAVAIAIQLALGSSLDAVLGHGLAQPGLLLGVALAVAASALLATWVPVRRATRVEPSVALRTE